MKVAALYPRRFACQDKRHARDPARDALNAITEAVPLGAVVARGNDILGGGVRGRIVVDVNRLTLATDGARKFRPESGRIDVAASEHRLRSGGYFCVSAPKAPITTPLPN